MHIIISRQRPTNQNHSEIPHHTYQDGFDSEGPIIPNGDKDVEQLEPSYIVSGSVE